MTILYRWGVSIIATMVMAALVFTMGYQYAIRTALKKEVVTATAKLDKATAIQGQIEKTNQAATVRYVTVTRTIQTRGDTLVKRIPVYITKTDDSNCHIPDGFRVHWDATLGMDPTNPIDPAVGVNGATPTPPKP